MKRILLRMAVLLLRIVYLPFRILPVRRRIAIISRQSDHKSSDIRLLSNYLRQVHPEYECVILCRFLGPGLAARISYAFHMLSQMRCIATSRVVILDGYCITACVLNHKPETKIVQMWHAVAAIKRFGYQTIDRPGGHSSMVSEVMCMHRNYDYILCPSEATGRIFCEAFRAGPEKLLMMGLPRLDQITGGDPEQIRRKIREEYRIPEEKELLVYVPTFRKDSPVRLTELIRALDPEKFALAVRLHPLEMPEEGDAAAGQGRLIYAYSHNTEDWLLAADRIITDYSALAVESTLTGKPLYFYVYDIDDYERKVGLNVDPRAEIPGATAVTGEELAALLDGPYPEEERRRFKEKYITVDTNACTQRLGEFIYGIAEKVH